MQEATFLTQDGETFHTRHWPTPGETCAHLVLIHGYGEHSGRYAEMAEVMNTAGIAVHSFDQRGFGTGPGKRGWVADYQQLLSDIDMFLEYVRPNFEGKPWFLMGHSMGGQLLACYAASRTLDATGLIFTSPFLAFPPHVPGFVVALSPYLGRLLPVLPVGGVDNQGLSRDPAVVAAADQDPLCYHGKVSAHTSAQFYQAIQFAQSHSAEITLPCYMIHGTADRVVAPAGTRTFYDGCAASDKSFQLYEGGYHELWNDLEKEKVLSGIIDWINAHID